MREPPLPVHRRGLLAGGAAAGLVLLAPAGATATTGRPFTTDLRLPGLLHAVVARPPVIGARLARLDASETLGRPGVVAVVELAPASGPALARLGGVAVLARDTWTALKGRDALQLAWTEAAEAVEWDDGFTDAPFVPETAEPLMEPPSAVVRAGARSCTAWACLRAPDRARAALARQLGLPLRAVALHETAPACAPDRFANPATLFEAARLSRAMGAPVSLVWTRADDIPFRVRPPVA